MLFRSNRLLQEVTKLAEAEWAHAGISLVLRLDHEAPTIHGDVELLRQAFLNLVLNACQAMPDGGTVTLSTQHIAQGTVRAQVTDQGVGIPSEELDEIFRLYYTTKPEGSGIGLSLVYRIVQMHGGSIEVESKVGKGTTMTVTFPTS